MTTRLCCTFLRSLWMIDQTGGIEYGIIPGRLGGTDTTSGPKLSRCHRSDKKKKEKEKDISDVLYSLGPRCVRGASCSLGSSSSDEFSWDSAPWSSLSFFAKLQPPHSLTSLFFFDITWKKRLHTVFILPFNVVAGFTVVRRCVCGEEVTAAGSYLRRCWRANGGARLLPFSSGSISSRLGSTMWLQPLSRQKALHNLLPVKSFKNKYFVKEM